jgi:hypothetical protein
MTLDEAIKQCEEAAEDRDKLCKRCDAASGYSRSHNEAIRTQEAKEHEKCSQDFRQLAGWLKELKAYKEQEPCADAISREAALMCMTGKYIADLEYKPDDIISQHIKRIKALPSVTSKRKTGKWIDGRCSECGCDAPAYIIDWKWQRDMNAKYCPNCGIGMEIKE